MSRLRTLLLVWCGWLAFACPLLAQQAPDFELEARNEDGLLAFQFENGLWIATNGLTVRYGDAVLVADGVALNLESGDVVADGKVRIQHLEQIWASEHLRYNFKTRQMEAEHFRTGKNPIFAAGEGLQADTTTNQVYTATNAFVTTDDISQPVFKIRAKYIRIVPGDRIEARHATLYLGEVPVFYFPFYARRLQAEANNWNFVPGYRTRFGPFLLSTYNWVLNQQWDGALHLDYRQRRGVGVGPDINYHLGKWGEGTFRYYYLHDEDPTADLDDPSIPENRQRLYFSHQSRPATNLETALLVRYQGDYAVVREFFEREYRQNPQPSSFLEVRKFWENFSLDVYAQPQVNEFFETVERLPDIRLTGLRQQVGNLPLYYESESSAGYYRRRFADTNGPMPLDYEAARADSLHQLLVPQTFFGWLNVTPRVGGRFTYYGKASGPGATTEEVYRGIFNTGAELSLKASRVWPALQSKWLSVDGLRHIVEPALNYAYVPTPTHHGTNQLPQFDYELSSLRLLPIDYPDYNAIDMIDAQNVLRLGLRNKLQTKRSGLVENLVNWDLYTDWRLDRRTDQTTFSDLYSDLTFKPHAAVTLESLIRYDIDGGRGRMALHTLSLQPNNVWSWTLSHFYLRDDFSPSPTALGEGNNLLTSRVYLRVNENWGFRAAHHFDARDGRMQEQDYTFYRDLRSWTAALTFRFRESGASEDDFTVAFTFSLKSYPRYGMGSDVERPYWLLGG